MTSPAPSHPADELLEQAQADPADYLRRADELFDRYTEDPSASIRVRWALGLALRELGDRADARRELQQAIDGALALGATTTAAMIRSSLAVVLLHLGDAPQALAETGAAAEALEGVDAARNEMQRALILQRLGRQDEAIEAYGRARPDLAAAGDIAAEGRLLSNRGILRGYRGELAEAESDLERAVALSRQLGATRPLALRLQNLGFVAGRRGRIPEALAFMEESGELFRSIDDDAGLAVLDVDRAELLADAGLFDEAIERAEAAAKRLAHDQVNGPEAELLVARFALLAGQAERARRIADDLTERFAAAGRDGWLLHARYVSLASRAATAGNGDAPTGADPASSEARSADEVDVDEAARLADALQSGGWATEARAARLFIARSALAAGRNEVAERMLEAVRGADGPAPALARAQHWYATALLRAGAGDRAGARRAVGSGLTLLDRSRLAFGSAELRAHAAAHTTQLVELAVRLALEDGRPAKALRFLDRVRATDVAVRVRPPEDQQLAHELAELRRLTEEERGAAQAGRNVDPLVGQRVKVERRVRDRTRTRVSSGGDVAGMRLDVAALRRQLAGRTLVAYLQLDGRLHALEVGPRRTRHHELGWLVDVRADVAYVRAAVRRLGLGQGGAAAIDAAVRSLERSAEDLTEALGLDRFDPDGLVVVPSGALNGLPWGALVGRSAAVPTVSPSAGAWLAAERRVPRAGGTLLVAGPDLPGAELEIADVVTELAADVASAGGPWESGVTVLRGSDASVAATLTGMQEAATAHVAAHGTFRADNPLFSSVRLADGVLTVYELEGLVRVPSLVILSSCEAASTTTVQGDAVLGLATVLLRLGVRSVIAPVVEVPDEATRPMMVDLHRRLVAGGTPRDALGEAIAAAPDIEPAQRAVRAAFVVLGR